MAYRALCAALLLSATAHSAIAAPVFLGTHAQRLYRTDGVGAVEQFLLSDKIIAMAVDESGTVWAASPTDDDDDGFFELYTLSDPLGANPTLQLVGDFLDDITPTISFIDGTLYGFQKSPTGLDDGVLITIDPGAQTQAIVGQTGQVGTGFAASGYDPDSDTLFMSAGKLEDWLYDVDYSLQNGPDPTGTLVANIDVDFENSGGEFFEGVYYALVQYTDGGPLVLGTVDVDTGHFTEIQIVGPASNKPIGLAVLPEPGSFLMLLAGASLLLWRKHRLRTCTVAA